MVMRKSLKNMVSIGLCLVMMLSLSACNNKDEWVFLLNGERIYGKDVAAFAYIYTTEYNIQSEEQLEEIYEDTTTYGEFYKQKLEEEIVSVVLLYKEADKKGVKLSENAKEQIESATAQVLQRFGKSVLEEAGVSETDIENVYEMKMLGEAYLDSLSVEEGNKKSEEYEPMENMGGKERYIKVYQVTFPIVELDVDGMVMSDIDGNLKKVSSAEMAQMKQNAMDFAEASKQGQDMESMLADYGSNVTGVEKYMKYSDLEQNYKKAVDDLSAGDVSGVIEADYGYYVIRLLEKNDTEYAETVAAREEETEQISVRETELERLRSEYAQPNREYKNVTMWDAIQINEYLK